MLKKIFLFISLLSAFFSISTFAQSSGYGKITEIIDGRTVVITNAGKKTTFMLQYIEVPEPEQQLSSVVKEHLEKSILSKDVKFISNSAYSKGLIGILFLGDIEINKQMLRDGAAWYDLPNNGNYNSEYKKMESLAKSEKRGVWGIEGLKPAWKFREDQFAKDIEAKKANKKPARETQLWAETGSSSSSGIDNFSSSYDKFTNFTEIRTSEMPLSVEPYDRRNTFTFRVSHFFKGTNSKDTSDGYYTVTIRSKGTMLFVPTLPELRLLINQDRLLLSSPELGFEGDLMESHPMFYEDRSKTYKINNKQFSMITTGVDVQFRYGGYEGVISAGQIASLKNLH